MAYYYNGKNATGCLKIARGVFIKYGEELPEKTDKGMIKDLEKRELITTEKSNTAVIHEIEELQKIELEDLKKEIATYKKENKKLLSKVESLEKDIKILEEAKEDKK
jgi:hypothetical protein